VTPQYIWEEAIYEHNLRVGIPNSIFRDFTDLQGLIRYIQMNP
jgi:hypothetical protein